MQRDDSKSKCVWTLLIAAVLTVGPAVAADKPPGAGGGKSERSERSDHDAKRNKGNRGDRDDHDDKRDKGKRNERGDRDDRRDHGDRDEHRDRRDQDRGRQRDGDDRSSHDGRRSGDRGHEHFGDRHRTLAHQYYRQEISHGRCPPGLAKRNNGCVPPGLARRWSVGRPLPRDVIFYDVPAALVVQFERPPPGYRYVRVAGDLLLIALGTGMVIDAIQDLGRM